MDRKTKFFVTLLIFLLGIAGVMYLGRLANEPNSTSEWYKSLNKSPLTPPGAVFPLAWWIIYFLMALAGATLYCAKKTSKRAVALALWGIQLLFNVLWSFFFFTFKNPLLAVFDIAFLWVAVILSVITAFRVSLATGWYLVPNALWVSFATYLNIMIVVLN